MLLKPGFIVKEQDGNSVRFKVYQAREYRRAQDALPALSMWLGVAVIFGVAGWAFAKAFGFSPAPMSVLAGIVAVVTMVTRQDFIPWKRKERLPDEPFHSFSVEGNAVKISYLPLFREGTGEVMVTEFSVSAGDIRTLAIRGLTEPEQYKPKLEMFPPAHRRYVSDYAAALEKEKEGETEPTTEDNRLAYMRAVRQYEVDIETADAVFPVALHLDKYTARALVLAIAEACGFKAAPQGKYLKHDPLQYTLK